MNTTNASPATITAVDPIAALIETRLTIAAQVGLLRESADRPGAERRAIERAFEETDELTRARAAGLRRMAALRRTAPDRAPRRLHDYLRRRGYPGDVVRQVLRALHVESADDRVDG